MGPTSGLVIAVVAVLFLPASVAPVLVINAGYSLLITLLGRWELRLLVQIAKFMFCIPLNSAFSAARTLLPDFPRSSLVPRASSAPQRTKPALATGHPRFDLVHHCGAIDVST